MRTRLETRQARFILIESEGFSMQRPRSVRARVRQRVDQDSAGENMEDFISIFRLRGCAGEVLCVVGVA
jgi:hypothetical protein